MKTPFLQKVKQGVLSSLALGGLYAGTLTYRGYAQEAEKPLKDSLEQNLSSPLTQQGEDFYKNPEKEFIFYKKTFTEAVSDGVIDSRDVEQLEGILRRTLEEMQNKIYDRGEAKFLSLSDTTAYSHLYKKNIGDLRELQKHLELKKEWLDSDACQGKFWNYGAGFFIYWNPSDDGNITLTRHPSLFEEGYKGLEETFKDAFYKENLPTLQNVGGFKISEICEEFPAKTKMNYWLGLALGFILPGLSFSFLAGFKERIMKKEIEKNSEEADFLVSHSALNPLFGYLLLDSIHPLVYPARLIIPPLIYACVAIASKPAPASPASSSAPAPAGFPKLTRPASPSELEEKVEKNELKIKDIPNPWDIDIPKIEDKKVGRSYGG